MSTDQSSNLPPLLRLPRELRDEIYMYFLYTNTEPPPNPSYPGGRIITYAPQPGVRYPFAPLSYWRYPSLVWTNRQIRSEYLDLISKLLFAGRARAELDIMFKGYLSWPTWTYLPTFLQRGWPFDLDVQLRIFSTEGFRSNDGWPRQPGTAFRDLLSMLTRLLKSGPDFGQNEKRQHDGDEANASSYRINKLSVNVSFHDDYTPATHPETATTIVTMLRELAQAGVVSGVVSTIHVHCECVRKGKMDFLDHEWAVAERVDLPRMKCWTEAGFLREGQRHLCVRSID